MHVKESLEVYGARLCKGSKESVSCFAVTDMG